jgi:hypothetical protein
MLAEMLLENGTTPAPWDKDAKTIPRRRVLGAGDLHKFVDCQGGDATPHCQSTRAR